MSNEAKAILAVTASTSDNRKYLLYQYCPPRKTDRLFNCVCRAMILVFLLIDLMKRMIGFWPKELGNATTEHGTNCSSLCFVIFSYYNEN